MKISILGLTITSAWGNGHATTYRSLCKALHKRGHSIRFLEKDVPWYSEHRDLPTPAFCEVTLYKQWSEVQGWLEAAAGSDLIIVGSYFPDGVAATDYLFWNADCPVFFYDIDTPITVESLRRDKQIEAVRAIDISLFDAYLSFTGGPILRELRTVFEARRTFPLYCSVDAEAYRPNVFDEQFACALSYLGTYSDDRQPKLEELLLAPARALPGEHFIVAGAQYPQAVQWPANVRRFEHVAPERHPALYGSSQFTLNLTRASMAAAGWSPSVRLFEAAACGAAIISDMWPGLEELLVPGKEILPAHNTTDVLRILAETTPQQRNAIGAAARARILANHTSEHRAIELEKIVAGVVDGSLDGTDMHGRNLDSMDMDGTDMADPNL